MRIGKRERSTFADRFFTALLSCLLTFVVFVIFSFALIRGAGRIENLYSWYWQLTFVVTLLSGIVGFLLGSRKMAEVFGYLFRTNKPKDGHWY